MKRAVKVIAFIVVLCLLLAAVTEMLAPSKYQAWAVGTGMELIHKYPDQYDVCFFGTSTSIANISNQELYEAYGIAGVSVAGGEQPMYLTRYVVEEALQYQHSAVFVVSVDGLFHGADKVIADTIDRGDYIVHGALDGIRTPEIKKRALAQVRTINAGLDMWEYYSDLYRYHSDWEILGERIGGIYSESDCMNGNITLYDIAHGITNYYDLDIVDATGFNQGALAALNEIVRLCRDAGTELVLFTSRVNSSKTKQRLAEELAAQYGVAYIDINEHVEEIGFSHDFDLSDGSHFNLLGAIKQAQFLGTFLKENYDITDKRGDPAYSRYEEQRVEFAKRCAFMYAKRDLLAATTFDDYLEALYELDKDKFVVLISVNDDAAWSMTDQSQDLLLRLGLKRRIKQYYRGSYAAVIDGDVIREELSPDKIVRIKGTSGDITYLVVSGGALSGGRASIQIDDVEQSYVQRGFNIVVYAKEVNQVVSSVFFDTCGSSDPQTGRYEERTGTEKQYEIAPNVWQAQE